MPMGTTSSAYLGLSNRQHEVAYSHVLVPLRRAVGHLFPGQRVILFAIGGMNDVEFSGGVATLQPNEKVVVNAILEGNTRREDLEAK
ncbi:hypothetical protein PINS_up016014 [Pythium insidiosum]|nr:hypothetical protein PINS_up016014 [Pythium insidiosum]